MALVTADEVKEIMDGVTLSDAIILTYAEAADLVIDSVFDGDTTTDSNLIKEIERWFTAHMIASTLWRTEDTEKVGDVSVKYTGQWGLGLDSTPYGQMVKQLDVSGKMGNIGKKVASMKAIESFDEDDEF